MAHDVDVLTEVFVHGALCIAFSGQCYSSSVSVGNSGNRGRCSQACRDEYEPTAMGNKYPFNLKDNSAYFDLPELVDAGVDSLKIEGRIKGANYVHTVVDSWRKQIDRFVQTGKLLDDNSNLYKVFNRDFTNLFLQGDMKKSMFIDNPRDHSFTHANQTNNATSVVQIQKAQQELSAKKNEISALVSEKIQYLDIAKRNLTFEFSGKLNEPLIVTVLIESGIESAHSVETQAKQHDPHVHDIPEQDTSMPETHVLDTHVVKSDMPLIAAPIHKANASSIDQAAITKRFKSFNNAKFTVESFNFSQLKPNLSIPFKELSNIRKKVALLLNDSVAVVPPADVPKLQKHAKTLSDLAADVTPGLSILIADEKDLHLCDLTDCDVYFKLPESFKKDCNKYIELFLNNPRLIPWFPAVLIGKDYLEAIRVLEEVKPKRIVSNNTGIAYKAFELNIDWIAGPFLNTTNSYALLTLKEALNCKGAFISNEINQQQIKNIAHPENFKLLYSIYHPILMMTSRQCFFQQTVGCKKPSIDDSCMLTCKKETTITNAKGVSFAIDKQQGGYPSIYNHEQFLNLNIVNDLAHLFDEFFIDLTDIGAGSKAGLDKMQLLSHFQNALKGVHDAPSQLHNMVPISTHSQYVQGL